jgi:hypothetical protein
MRSNDAVQLGHLRSMRATTHLAVANLGPCLYRRCPASVDGRNMAGFAVITRIWGDRPTNVATSVSGLVNRRGQLVQSLQRCPGVPILTSARLATS